MKLMEKNNFYDFLIGNIKKINNKIKKKKRN